MGTLRSGGDRHAQPPGGPIFPGTPMHPSGAPPPGPPVRGFSARAARWLVLAAALFGALALCCAGVVAMVAVSLPDGYPRPDASPGGSGDAPGRLAGIGDPVRDGRLTFVVHRVDCGVKTVGRPPRTRAAHGQYCLVQASVSNTHPQPATFSDAHQRALGPGGDEYRVDHAANALTNPGTDLRQVRIAPAGRLDGTFVFDVPTGGRIERLRWHESAVSAGAEVAVR